MQQSIWFAALAATLIAAEHRGQVRFGGLPLPGAIVSAIKGEQKLITITDPTGAYLFADLAEGEWKLSVEMQMFKPQQQTITVPIPPLEWTLLLATPPEIKPRTESKSSFQKTELSVTKMDKPKQAALDPVAIAEATQRAADGLLINGSVNNGAASAFAQLPAFGNNRRGQRSLYNGNLGLIASNALFDARPFSITGIDIPKPDYGRTELLFAFGGPIKIPGWIRRNGPIFSINYQRTRNRRAVTQSGLVPTLAQRAGDLGETRVPVSEISPQARALLALYPLPNFRGSTRFNFQVPVVNGLHHDDLQTRINKQRRSNFFTGSLAWRSTRSDTPDLFGYLETGHNTGWNTAAAFRHSFSARAFVNVGVQWSSLETDVIPFFSNRRNISGEAGIQGNNQDAPNWGPPSLSFASGFAPLGMAQASRLRNQTASTSIDSFLNRGRHNIAFGYTFRHQQFNALTQQDARGAFSFTDAHDLEKFLRGLPDASSIAFGNADKYLRGNVHEAFVNDDWRVNPSLTINWGLRWEYWSPLTEKYGRLVNLALGPNFASAQAVVANQGDAAKFLQPDRNNLGPRFAFSWRPLLASSMVIRGGYGVYFDTSLYQNLTMRMAQQAPLSKSLRISNTPQTPITLANGFDANGAPLGQETSFAVDPEFRIGYAHTWQLSIQRDLPWALQATATYLGSKGTRGQQQILPNTFPDIAANPSGFTYLASNGNANRSAAQLQFRRRLRSGFSASINYTYAKAIDNTALGGQGQGPRLTAQNWLDFRAERALSNFDQRHLLSSQLQYSPGIGLHGGALAMGKLASVLKDWTIGAQINTGTGLPLTPVILRPVVGTGASGSLRPDYTGAPIYDAPPGLSLNPAAYKTPASGSWGNAGRNTITGPAQFAIGASLARSFRSSERVSYDFRIDATNILNTVTYPDWNTIVGNVQFGLPNTANPMRSFQAVMRMRF